MKFKLFILLIFMLLQGLKLLSQEINPVTEQFIAGLFEQYAEESDEDLDFETYLEDLMLLSYQPINLNKTHREELEKLFFLSDMQIENILYYQYRFGTIQTLYELQLVDGLGMNEIRNMLPFVYVGDVDAVSLPIRWNDVRKRGKNEVLMRFDRTLEQKQGYLLADKSQEDASTINAKKYLGSPLYHSVRYRFRYKDRLQWGITAEKDAGEQFWGSAHKGYDFYSAHVQVTDVGKFKNIVLGDYKANFGNGLVVRSDFSMGKSSYVLNVSPRANGLRKYSSANEENFFRGAGATLRFGRTDVTAFFSVRKHDADTAGQLLSSLYTTGYHRTLNELNKKNTVGSRLAGVNMTQTGSWWQIGFTGMYTKTDLSLKPNKSIYNYHYFEGDQLAVWGAHYRLRWHKLNVFGETAMMQNQSVATLNGVSFSPFSRVSLVVLQRAYGTAFDNRFAIAFSETSRINNEKGIYVGAEVRPYRKWKLAAYADSYWFDWPKYGIDQPSVGKDFLLQTDYTPSRRTTMLLRAKYEEKLSNMSGTGEVLPVVVPLRKFSSRYQLSYSYSNFTFRNTLEYNWVRKGDADFTYGAMALQDISYVFRRLPLRIDLRYQFFDAIDYQNRFYTYERDVLYAFSIPVSYGLGSRYYLNLKYEYSKQLSVWLKLSQTRYADERETISSGNEQIVGNSKTDIRLLLKWSL